MRAFGQQERPGHCLNEPQASCLAASLDDDQNKALHKATLAFLWAAPMTTQQRSWDESVLPHARTVPAARMRDLDEVAEA